MGDGASARWMACTPDGLIRGTHQYGWIFVPEWILPGEWSGPSSPTRRGDEVT